MRYRFAQFELDTGTLNLAVDGASVDADPRMLQLLALLIEAWPEHCGQRALLDRLWPTTTVAHWSLAKLVSDTRKLFRGYGYGGPLIQTLHGRGYRLAPEFAAQLRPADAPQETGRARRWRPLLAGVLSLAIAATLAWLVFAPAGTQTGLRIGEPPGTIGRVLWVDDHPENNAAERAQLKERRVAVYSVTGSDDALKLLAMYDYDAVISDMGRGEDPLAGLKLLESMRAEGNPTPFFLYTILSSEAQRQLLAEHGGQGVAATEAELYKLVLPALGLEPPPAEATEKR